MGPEALKTVELLRSWLANDGPSLGSERLRECSDRDLAEASLLGVHDAQQRIDQCRGEVQRIQQHLGMSWQAAAGNWVGSDAKHWITKPATVRDVISARNFVARTTISAVNNVVTAIGMVTGLGIMVAADRYGWPWWLGVLLGLAGAAYIHKQFRSVPSKELEASEELVRTHEEFL